MTRKSWILSTLCGLLLIFAIELFSTGNSYQNLIIPKGMDTFPVYLMNFRIGEGSTTIELNSFANTFMWLSLVPLLLASLIFQRLLKRIF